MWLGYAKGLDGLKNWLFLQVFLQSDHRSYRKLRAIVMYDWQPLGSHLRVFEVSSGVRQLATLRQSNTACWEKPACTLMNVPLKAHPNRNLTDSMMAPVPLTTMSSLHYDRHGPLHPGCWRFRSSVALHSWHRTTWDLSRPSRCRGSIFLRKTNGGFLGDPMGFLMGFNTKSWSMPTAPGGLAMASLGLDDHGWTRRWLLVSRRRWRWRSPL